MSTSERFQDILETVKAAYGSLDEPNYAFTRKRYAALRCHPIVGDLMSNYFIKDETDLNDHVSLHLRILHPEGSVVVCLSFVNKWAMLFRLKRGTQVYADVISPGCSGVLPAERDIMALLDRHGFALLTRTEAATPIRMRMSSTDEDEVRLYHAIVSDDGVVPQVLLR